MSDDFPNADTLLQLDEQHLIWKFSKMEDKLATIHVGYHGCLACAFDMHMSYILAFVCFDLEYWRAMLLPHTLNNGNILLKVQMHQRYMQNLRIAMATSISNADASQLREGSWNMAIGNEWCIRTWNNYSHSPFGRTQYLEKCQKNGQVPYSQTLTYARK